MRFGRVSLTEAEGAILAHGISVGERVFKKATLLTPNVIAELAANGIHEVVAAVLAPDDLDENVAASRIAGAISASGIEVRAPSTGRVNLHAVVPGIFCVDKQTIDALNAIDPSITIATLPDYATVDAGQMVATIKIIPFAVNAGLVSRASAIAARPNMLKLNAFSAKKVGLIQTVLPSVKGSVLDKTSERTSDRLARSGSIVAEEIRTAHDAGEVGQAITALQPTSDLIIIFGASAVSDVDDVLPTAIREAGGEILRVGMPVDPGNLLVLGRLGGKTIIGAPGCARSPKLNGFDWVLDRILAGIAVTSRDIAQMGVGGLLMEIETRPQPREPKSARAKNVAAILLAAGRGQRMGGPNKLLAEFDGIPLVRRVADVLAASKATPLVAVTGHQGERVEAALSGHQLRIVENTDFASGLASSLKAGIAALPPDVSGALIALGDMPGVSTRDIDLMIDAFKKAGGSAIVRATHAGKRGNPVILPRALFPRINELGGDTGARHLVETSDLPVIDVEIGAAASLDVDTPEAMAKAGGVLVG